MAQTDDEGLFRRSTMSRIASTDDLDRYIKVNNPSAWVIVLAALTLVVGLAIWAFVAVVPVTIRTTGFAANDGVLIWVDESTADKIRNFGAKVQVNGVDAQVDTVLDLPMSSSEVASMMGSDFVLEAIDLDDWNYMVTIKLGDGTLIPDYEVETEFLSLRLVPVSVVVMEDHPINIILQRE